MTTSQMASLQSSVFTFLDQNFILFPSSIGDGLCVYDIRTMPPINTRKQKLKGTHCFETSIPHFLGNEADCSIDLTSNSLATGASAAVGSFYADPDDCMISLRITNPVGAHAGWRQEHHEMHVRAQLLVTWTKMHPAPPNACVVIPWSVWAPAAARMVVQCIGDDDAAYMCPSQSRFSGCGMRIASSPFVRKDGTFVVTITDYHPARVFRGRRQNVLRRADTFPADVEATFGNKAITTNVELDKHRVEAGAYPRLRSKSLPLPTVRVLFTPSIYNPRFSQLSILAHPTFVLRQ